MTLDTLRAQLLPVILEEVPFEGWTPKGLAHAAKQAGFTEVDLVRAFPGGAVDVIAYWNQSLDTQAAAVVAAATDLKIREKITLGVRTRLTLAAPHKEAVRRGLGLLALPGHAGLAARLLSNSMNALWYAAGDRATDFNFYTKRGLLAGVYVTTLLFWLDDETDGAAATWVFLDKRIADAMRLPSLLDPVKRAMQGLAPPFRRPRPAPGPA
ncbi:MAG: COQ9 family protein [Elstera sp.]